MQFGLQTVSAILEINQTNFQWKTLSAIFSQMVYKFLILILNSCLAMKLQTLNSPYYCQHFESYNFVWLSTLCQAVSNTSQ